MTSLKGGKSDQKKEKEERKAVVMEKEK